MDVSKFDYKNYMPEQQANKPMWELSHIKGFHDLTPPQQVVLGKWRQQLADTFTLYGFNHFDVPLFIHRKHALGKPEDAISKEIFSIHKLKNNKMTDYAIAYDRTVPMALWVKKHFQKISFPFKRYDIGYSYRSEKKTKKGRLHGFWQCDVDVIGPNLPITSDVECITVLIKALQKLPIPPFTMLINHIGLARKLISNAGFVGKAVDKASAIIDRLDKTEAHVIVKELQELDSEVQKEKLERLVKICSYRGPMKDFPYGDSFGEGEKAFLDDVKTIFTLVEGSGLKAEMFEFAPGLVRGLTYYTGPVFETFINGRRDFGSIASGGRYDGLVDEFTHKDKPLGINGVGGSIGLSRLFASLIDQKLYTCPMVQTSAQVCVLVREKGLFNQAVAVAAKLRENGVRTDLYTGHKKRVSDQLKHANRAGFPVAVMVMNDDSYVVRRLRLDENVSDEKKQEDVNTVAKSVEVALGYLKTTEKDEK